MVIEIVGLSLCIPDLIWTIITFFLLMFLLKKFLYTPVLKFMDERNERIAAGINAGKQAAAALSEQEAMLKTELAEAAEAARSIINTARSEAEKAKCETMHDAHKLVEQLHSSIRSKLADEEADAEASVNQNIPELAALLCAKMLCTDNGIQNQKLAKSCINAAGNTDGRDNTVM